MTTETALEVAALKAALRAAENERDMYRAAEERLRLSESWFTAFMDNLPGNAGIKDAQGRYVFINSHAERAFDVTLQDLLGKSDFDWLPADVATVLWDNDRRVLEDGETLQVEEEAHGKNGATHWLSVKFPIEAAGGTRLLGNIALDVTERRALTQRLEQHAAELEAANTRLRAADRVKDEFLSVISHELRTPLNFITGFASTLQDEVFGPLNPDQVMALDRILKGADLMLGLVDDLLDFAKIQAGMLVLMPESTAFGPLVTEVVTHLLPLAERKGIRLDTALLAGVSLEIDGPRVSQVLTNLLSNAIKFTPADGEVRITARLEGDRLVTEVADTGCGIAAEELPKLFQRFFQVDSSATRAAAGTGLGLAIAKAFVEAHGGEIGVTSTLGLGSRFWFSLPLSQPPSP